MKRILLSWSSGKDSAWTLHRLRAMKAEGQDLEVMGLLTTFNEAADRVAMHAVRRRLAQAQADSAELPLQPVMLPWPCSNDDYEEIMGNVVDQALADGVTHMAFGDLYLEDIRAYREGQLADTGLAPIFPLWGTKGDTRSLAESMIDSGLEAVITCVDPKQIGREFLGRKFDRELLADLPTSADPCGENGEFHTFCHAGPMYRRPIEIQLGEVVERDGFWFQDLL